MIVKLLTEHHLEFLSLKGGCRASSESTLVKMSNCWKSHAAAHFRLFDMKYLFLGLQIYCLSEILLLLENLDRHCLSVEFLNLARLGCQCIPYMFIYRLTMTILAFKKA